MYQESPESWTDTLFWGVTIVIALLLIGAPLAVYFQWLPLPG